jgi:aminodeoxyfutalosine deaminase
MLILADGAIDAVGTSLAPAAILVRWATTDDPSPLGCEILAVGDPDEIRYLPQAKGAAVLVNRNAVLMPGMVNSHTHLDLTHIGPQPHDSADGFPEWGRMIMQRRAKTTLDITRSVRQGIERAIAGGVVAVGDIAGVGSEDAARELHNSPLAGVSFIEYFGFGDAAKESHLQALAALNSLIDPKHNSTVRIGLQPHAPYSASMSLYKDFQTLAAAHDAPLCTHLAESSAEHELIRKGKGPMQGLLRDLGIWNESVAKEFNKGKTPVEHLKQIIRRSPMLLIHLNDVTDSDIAMLAASKATVVYCPRSSSYFGNDQDFGPHRYQEMIEQGIPVVLGTDSVVNLPPEPNGQFPTLSVLPEMRFLHARDGFSPIKLFEMGTTLGARALGLEESAYTLRPGILAGLVSVAVDTQSADEPMQWVLDSPHSPRLLGPGVKRALSGQGQEA